MKKHIFILISISLLSSCNQKLEEKDKSITNQKTSSVDTIKTKSEPIITELKKNISDFVPEGFVIYEEEGMEDIKGDLNGDGLQDVVFLIKGTDKTKFVNHEYRGKSDRNRRGIIILFNRGDGYELATKNYDCFSSENEEGGVYYAPELWLAVEKGNLKINYGHGRYGYWNYTFRNKNGEFELIGYDASYNQGPMPLEETSINFLTKKKLTRKNINRDNFKDDENVKFKDTWEIVKVNRIKKLSEIKDFDELES